MVMLEIIMHVSKTGLYILYCNWSQVVYIGNPSNADTVVTYPKGEVLVKVKHSVKKKKWTNLSTVLRRTPPSVQSHDGIRQNRFDITVNSCLSSSYHTL